MLPRIAVSLLSFVLLIATPWSAGAEDAPSMLRTGPHGGVIAAGGGQRMELTLDPASNSVRVFVLQRTVSFPGALGISLRDSLGNETLLELKTMDPNRHPILYSGSLTGGSQSFVGFELKIPLGRQPDLLIRGNLGEYLRLRR